MVWDRILWKGRDQRGNQVVKKILVVVNPSRCSTNVVETPNLGVSSEWGRRFGKHPVWRDAQVGETFNDQVEETPKLGRCPSWGDAQNVETPKIERRPDWASSWITETTMFGERPVWENYQGFGYVQVRETTQVEETPRSRRRPGWASLLYSFDPVSTREGPHDILMPIQA